MFQAICTNHDLQDIIQVIICANYDFSLQKNDFVSLSVRFVRIIRNSVSPCTLPCRFLIFDHCILTDRAGALPLPPVGF